MSETKQYAERDVEQLDKDGDHYIRHVMAMTSEALHSKADIAAELAYRDWLLTELTKRHEDEISRLEDIIAYYDPNA